MNMVYLKLFSMFEVVFIADSWQTMILPVGHFGCVFICTGLQVIIMKRVGFFG